MAAILNPMPGIVRMGEFISFKINFIASSISVISAVKSAISFIVCFNSNDFAGILDPIESRAISRISSAADFPKYPFDATLSIVASFVK